MASIARDKNGCRRILFVAPDGKRPTIRLGKVSQRTAEGVKYRVEQLLESLHYRHPVEGELAQWVANLEPRMAKRLAAVGLIEDRESPAEVTLGSFLQSWLAARRGDYSLRWQDVDWERGQLTVPSPKTQHLAGRGYRVIPLFPVVRPYLEAAWDAAPEGAEYVIPEEYRRRAQGPAGWANANLRTTLKKVIRRAGLEPWSRLWHSMRASCETDLARQFPLAVVAKWLGNTQAVAMRHYVDVTDADFERATMGGEPADEKCGAKSGAVGTRRDWLRVARRRASA